MLARAQAEAGRPSGRHAIPVRYWRWWTVAAWRPGPGSSRFYATEVTRRPVPGPGPRRWSALAGMACTLAACTAIPAGPTPAEDPTGTTSSGLTPLAQVETFQRTSGVILAGIEVRQLVAEDPRRPISVRWPVVPGARRLNTAVTDWATATQQRFIKDHAPATVTEAAAPELNVSWNVVVASGDVVGVELSTYLFAGADGATSQRSVYSDVAADEVWAGEDLLSVDGRAACARVVVQAVERSGRAVFPEVDGDPEGTRGLFDDVDFDPLGGMLITVSEGVISPMSEGLITVRIPDGLATAWLSREGRAVREAVRSGATYSKAAASAPTAPPTTPGAAPSGSPTTQTASPRPGRSVDCRKIACVALTFDDGPAPTTPGLLDILRKAKVRATFFVIGRNVTAQPQVVRREVAEGHVVGNHTWSHRDLAALSAEDQQREVDLTSEELAKVGVRTTLLRPPYGSFDKRSRRLGSALVLWDVDPLDWRDHDAALIARRVVSSAHRGSIVLLHDIHPTTVAAVPAIIQGLRAKGLTLVTVPEVLGGPPKTGKAYYARGTVD